MDSHYVVIADLLRSDFFCNFPVDFTSFFCYLFIFIPTLATRNEKIRKELTKSKKVIYLLYSPYPLLILKLQYIGIIDNCEKLIVIERTAFVVERSLYHFYRHVGGIVDVAHKKYLIILFHFFPELDFTC